MNYHLKIKTTILYHHIGIKSNITIQDPKVKNVNQLHFIPIPNV